MGQSVTLDHPMSRRFLERDISNIARYFKKKYDIGTAEEIWGQLRLGREVAKLRKGHDMRDQVERKETGWNEIRTD